MDWTRLLSNIDAFFVDTPAWRVRAIGRALEILDRSIDGLRALEP